MKQPFERTFEDLQVSLEESVDAVFASLESEFLVMPKGQGFVEYQVFEAGYENLKRQTNGFQNLDPAMVIKAVYAEPIGFVILRTILGFTPPEWAYLATQKTGTNIPQGAIRSIDRSIRMDPKLKLQSNGLTAQRIQALVDTACEILKTGAPMIGAGNLHRLDKADTKNGIDSLHNVAGMGIPYAMLLYERFLGRPFASHKDSISELVGDNLESAIEEVLSKAGVSFRKTKRAERIEGFDQAPDFIIPSEFNPHVVIEAKITEDDGTARDKVTRIQHLDRIRWEGREPGDPKFEVIACIGGRGFKVRRADMEKMLLATRGKVFTLQTLDGLVTNSQIRAFQSL